MEPQRNECLETMRFFLKASYPENMVNDVSVRLDMPIKHRGIAFYIQLMRGLHDIKPPLAAYFSRTELFPCFLIEYLTAPSRKTCKPCFFQAQKHFFNAHSCRIRKMRDLDCCVCLQ